MAGAGIFAAPPPPTNVLYVQCRTGACHLAFDRWSCVMQISPASKCDQTIMTPVSDGRGHFRRPFGERSPVHCPKTGASGGKGGGVTRHGDIKYFASFIHPSHRKQHRPRGSSSNNNDNRGRILLRDVGLEFASTGYTGHVPGGSFDRRRRRGLGDAARATSTGTAAGATGSSRSHRGGTLPSESAGLEGDLFLSLESTVTHQEMEEPGTERRRFVVIVHAAIPRLRGERPFGRGCRRRGVGALDDPCRGL